METNPYSPPKVSGDVLLEAQASVLLEERIPELLARLARVMRFVWIASLVIVALHIVINVGQELNDPYRSVPSVTEQPFAVRTSESALQICLFLGWTYWYRRIAATTRAAAAAPSETTLTALFEVLVTWTMYESAAAIGSQLLESHRDHGVLAVLAGGAMTMSVRADVAARLYRWSIVSVFATLAALAMAVADFQHQPPGQGHGMELILEVLFDAALLSAFAVFIQHLARFRRTPSSDALLRTVTSLHIYWRRFAIVQTLIVILGALGLIATFTT